MLWGAFIEDRIDELKANDGKVTVAALVMNNDFGKAYDGGFSAWLEQTDVKADIEYVTEIIEPAAPTITDPMTTLASKNPEVFIAMTAGTSCTQAVTEAAQNGLKETGAVPVPAVGVQEQRLRRQGQGGRRRLGQRRLVRWSAAA
ncbi:MAG: hypothetical protein R2755_26755 [Acidimicrobiales bacterium]